MRDHDDRDPKHDALDHDAIAEMAEARGRETVRNRMLELWRSAVDCVVRVEQVRVEQPETAAPPPVTWRPWGVRTN